MPELVKVKIGYNGQKIGEKKTPTQEKKPQVLPEIHEKILD
jgi:hypothetical protein